jgi:hypothetical protein
MIYSVRNLYRIDAAVLIHASLYEASVLARVAGFKSGTVTTQLVRAVVNVHFVYPSVR